MGTPKDKSPSAHPYAMSSARWVSTKHGRALGRTAAISVYYTDSSDFNFNEKETTLVLDVVPPEGYLSASQDPIVKHFTGGGGSSGWFWALLNNGKIQFMHQSNAGQKLVNSDDALHDGEKHQLIATLSDSAGTGLLYVDGVLQAMTASWTPETLKDYVGFLSFHANEKTPILRSSIYTGVIFTQQDATDLWAETQKEAYLTHIPDKAIDPNGTDYVKYYQNGKDWNVSIANVTSGFLGNSGWTVNSGTWKIVDNGEYKVLSCIATGQLTRWLEGASGMTTTTFEQVSGTPTLTKNANNLQIDAITGAKVGIISLT